jgi:hypothetical protein
VILYCDISKYIPFYIGFRMAQSREQASFISEIVVRFSRQTRDIYGKRIRKRSTESRGFSPVTSVSSHKEC